MDKKTLESLGLAAATPEYVAKLQSDRQAAADEVERLSSYLQLISTAPSDQVQALVAEALGTKPKPGQD